MLVVITVLATLVGIYVLGGVVARRRRAQLHAIQRANPDAITRWVVLQNRKSYALVISQSKIGLLTLRGQPSEEWPRSAVTGTSIKKMGPSVPPRTGLLIHFAPQFEPQYTLAMFFPRGDGFRNSPRTAREIQAVLSPRGTPNPAFDEHTEARFEPSTEKPTASHVTDALALVSLATGIAGFVIIFTGYPRAGNLISIAGVIGVFIFVRIGQSRTER